MPWCASSWSSECTPRLTGSCPMLRRAARATRPVRRQAPFLPSSAIRSSGNRAHHSTTSRSWVTTAAQRCPSGQGGAGAHRSPARHGPDGPPQLHSERDTTGWRLRPAVTRGFSAAGTRPCRSAAVERCSDRAACHLGDGTESCGRHPDLPRLAPGGAGARSAPARLACRARPRSAAPGRNRPCSATSRRDRSIRESSPKRSEGRSRSRDAIDPDHRQSASGHAARVRYGRAGPLRRAGAAHPAPRHCWLRRRRRGRCALPAARRIRRRARRHPR